MTLVLAYTPAGTYSGAPTLVQATADLRQDLFDRVANVPAGTSQRWADDDLTRALDRAVDEYSRVAPLVEAVQTATLPWCRSYAYPPGAWWIESVEYPAGYYPQRLVDFEDGVVTAGLGVPPRSGDLLVVAGPLVGPYAYALSYVKSGGESLLSAPVSWTFTQPGGAQFPLPTGPAGTVGRNVYRSKAGGGFVRCGQVLDNTTTTFVDQTPDVALVGAPAAPAADTTANLTQVLLHLSDGRLPRDTSGTLVVTYARKHELTGVGTSVPERHKDVILCGAAAYAILAYQVPTNDLFDYQDGELRDRVDETKVAVAWMAAGKRALGDFQGRLATVKNEQIAGQAAVARWGDRPRRWGRL